MLFTLLISATALLTPAYRLETLRTRHIEATLTHEARTPNLVAKEWILVAPRLLELPGQTDVRSTLVPEGKETEDLSPLRRPLLLARVAANREQRTNIVVEVHYEATLRSRRLVPLKEGEEAPRVPPLTDEERKHALRASKTLDFEAKAFQQWLDAQDLRRPPGEGEIAFARRVFQYITRHYTYQWTEDMKREATALCRAQASDCGGLSVLFVATLRANQVPARLLVGRWAKSAKKGETVDGSPYYQEHVKAEFHAAGVGWVPVDLARAVTQERGKEGLEHFGNDAGDFLVLDVDPDLVVDTKRFGKQPIEWLQGVGHWVAGDGSLKGTSTHQDWQVRSREKD